MGQMISRLFISNYALIDTLEIAFDDGLTIITGETGAGKSIILGALSLLLGERTDARTVRDASRKIVVEATFDIAGYDLQQLFDDNDIEYYEHECILRREVAANGRSRAFVNDSPVSVALLKSISTRLIDIHSQHSNLLLSTQAFQLDILDSMADNSALRGEYVSKYEEWREAEKKLKAVKSQIEKSNQEQDYISFQLEQFHEINLKENEDVELEQQQVRLSRASELRDALCVVDNILDSSDYPVLGQLKDVRQNLLLTEGAMDETKGMAQRIDSVVIELKDIARSVQMAQDALSDDPARLEAVNDRLDTIYALERKHSVQSVNELIGIQRDYEQKMLSISHADACIAELESKCTALKSEVLAIATIITSTRKQAAEMFVAQFTPLVGKLGLKNIAFDIAFQQIDLSETGADGVEFLMAFNKNQALMPVKDTASGGEISRVMLCIKSIIARSMHLPTIIFDEIDTGVSGDIATMVGELMADIATTIQVMAITHLPQVAACAANHLKVYKTDCDGGTVTGVKPLDDNDHLTEVARMLSGRGLDDAAINNAKSLIDQYKRR